MSAVQPPAGPGSLGETYRPGLLQGRRALVAGATQGIGAVIASHLAALGAEVTALGLGPGDGTLAAAVEARQCDVTSAESLDAALADLPELDIVFNCAGIIQRGAEHDLEVFQRVLDVNLTGTMRVCTATRARLKARRGCIVNTASMLSFFGGGLVPGYAASKGGVAQLTKSLAIAYAPDGIRVNAVAPGWIATPLTQALQDDPARSGPILARTPLGRWGTPDEVARAAVFLCTPAAGFMTGVILPVDGGYMVT
ncbi:SDR family NAD(P)-dependent oxidoreductase [Pseudorhodoferax sp.]|uniref:SDR family NAD(P)-dependent oxidoreductase n=1 Tax=Pseudorhodoferax sp. TaxID=1993553 RepID=UPI0039E60414